MDETKDKIKAILEKSPLPVKMKEYYVARLEREGVNAVLIESIKGMLRAVENASFGRMGVSVDEDDDPEIKRAVKMYSAAVEDAMTKYMKAMEAASGKVTAAGTKAAKKIEKLEKEALKANIS